MKTKLHLHEKYHALASNIADGIIFTSQDGIIQEVNQAVQHIYGYQQDDLLGRNIIDLIQPHVVIDFQKQLRNMDMGGTWFSSIHLKKTGESFPVEVFYRKVIIEWKLVYLLIIKDISSRKDSEAIAWYTNRHDANTGLPNFKMFNDKCELALTQAQKNNEYLAIFAIHLNNLADININSGYSVGDKILGELGMLLQENISSTGSVYYLGGNNFALLFTKHLRSEIEKTAQEILNSIDGFRFYHGMPISASIGIAVFPDDGYDRSTLRNNSEIALIHARSEKQNAYKIYHTSMSDAIQERIELEHGLRQSLDQNRFVLHYQPYADTKTLQIVGIEALVRWEHPIRGLVAPETFIPAAEKSGLIIGMGEYILGTACMQNKRWQDMGCHAVPVAVNISARQFYERDFSATVGQILNDTGLKPEYLTLEITESIMIESIEDCSAKLKKLAELGIKISLDDFGTGYSSLSYLQKLPIHTLKIDKSFIDGVAKSRPQDEAIVRAIINLAHNMNLSVIAEGVEYKEQLECLLTERCDMIQGYFFSRPISVNDTEKILMESSNRCAGYCLN